MEVKRDEEEYKHVCRLCNKKYPSGKSLGGHMRSHVVANSYVPLHKLNSKKGLTFCSNKKGKKVEKGFKELAMDSHSENERYRAIALIDSISLENNCSSDNSEIEQEEVALWLMMLSRDSGQRVGLSFTTESSDNNSVILEGKSSSKRKVLSCLSDGKNRSGNGSVKMKELASKKVACVEMDSSDSGYFENGAKEVESDDSVDGYARKYGIKSPKAEFRSGYDVYECEFRKRSKKTGNHSSDSTPIAPVEVGGVLSDQPQLKKFPKNGVKARGAKMQNDHLSSTQAPSRSPHNAGKYKCSICQRAFKTHQALGGHILTHRSGFRNRGNGENSSGTSKLAAKSTSKPESIGGGISSKKGHCCPFCPKVFKSGQALGGHKRSHFIGRSSQDKANQVQSIEEKPPANPRLLLDLNLPPSSVEDNGSNGGGGSPRLLF